MRRDFSAFALTLMVLGAMFLIGQGILDIIKTFIGALS